MAIVIKPLDSLSSGLPPASILKQGQLWINSTDKVIGTKNAKGEVVVLSDLTQEKASSMFLAKTASAVSAAKLDTARILDGVQFDGTANVSHYAVCNTAAETAEKTITVDRFSLQAGAFVFVDFPVGSSASAITLNVSNTGAKPVKLNDKDISSIEANACMMLVYTGTEFHAMGGGSGPIDLTKYYSKEEMDAKFLPILSPSARGTVNIYDVSRSEAKPLIEAYNAAKASSSSGTNGMLNLYTKEEVDALFAPIMNPVIVESLSITNDQGRTKTFIAEK